MYADLPADRRKGHPFHMYDEIRLQPEAVARSLAIVAEQGAPVATAIGAAGRVWLTGAGTSLHAAEVGAWALRAFSRGRVDARAIGAFELATYLPGLRPDDLVVAVTHSGATTMTDRAVDRAARAGVPTVAVTGFPNADVARHAAQVLPTGYGEERSWAHTASYTAAVASLLALANDLAQPEERLDLSPLPEVMREALGTEELMHRLAASSVLMDRYREEQTMVVIGGGPARFTAREGVLKLVETSYCRAAAFELEAVLHGPLAAFSPETLVMLIVPAGLSTWRAAELARAVRAIGVEPVVFCAEENASHFDDAHRFLLPDLPEVLSPLPYVVPLQFFSYFLSMGKGHNPDLLRRDDPRYRRAREMYA